MSHLPPTQELHRSQSRRRRSSASEDGRTSLKHPRMLGSVSPLLCGKCQCLDLDGIIASRKYTRSAMGDFVMYLESSLTSTCTLCNFFGSMRIPLPPRDAKPSTTSADVRIPEHGYHLRAFSGTVSYREYFLRPPKPKRVESEDTMLAVVPNGLFSDKHGQQHYGDTFAKVGYILPVAFSSRAPWLTGRPVDPLCVNFAVVQDWLRHCKKKHSCTMRYSRPGHLKMIDCKTMEIVTPPPNCNYFALSYVWGMVGSSDALPTPEPQSSHDVLGTAAPVVRDAISVVKSLGWRYLWVDKYCIPQHDRELKGEQIRKMDLIYEGAYCTIVAASGSSDQHGLPGIHVRRKQQPFVEIGNSKFVSTLPDPQQEIRKSVWMTRAWTYQEALCSARRLIFTENQVYFECKAMHCCEAVEVPLNLLHGPDGKALQSYIRPMLFRDEWLQGTHRFGPLSAFWTTVRHYADRRMTYDSDSLNAIEGILRRFQSNPAFVYNIMGIPLLIPNGNGKESLLSPNLFVSSLSWHHAGLPRRRTEFPSWTWAGWEGAIELPRTFGGPQYETDMRLSVGNKSGEKVEWETFWDEFWTPEGKKRCYEQLDYLIVEANIFKVQLTPRAMHQPHRKSGSKGLVFDMTSPYDGTAYSSVLLSPDLINSRKTKDDLWDCVLLGMKAKASNPNIMLVRWNVDVAERIWAGTLFPTKKHPKSIYTNLPPLLWKRFKLK